MTRWNPDTCNCVIDYDRDFQNAVFVEQCRTHNTPQQTADHNRGFNQRDGKNPTDPQLESQFKDKILEKKKPQFQKR